MNEQIKVVSKKNWVAPASIVAGVIGIFNFVIYIVGNFHFMSAFLFSLYSFAMGIFLGIIGLIVGILEKEGKGLAIFGIALSAFLLSRLIPVLLIQ
jgi:hypothetical protein